MEVLDTEWCGRPGRLGMDESRHSIIQGSKRHSDPDVFRTLVRIRHPFRLGDVHEDAGSTKRARFRVFLRHHLA